MKKIFEIITDDDYLIKLGFITLFLMFLTVSCCYLDIKNYNQENCNYEYLKN